MTPALKLLDRSGPRLNCQSDMLDPETRKHGKLYCQALATVTVDGKPMCRRHAGSFLVEMFLKRTAAE